MALSRHHVATGQVDRKSICSTPASSWRRAELLRVCPHHESVEFAHPSSASREDMIVLAYAKLVELATAPEPRYSAGRRPRRCTSCGASFPTSALAHARVLQRRPQHARPSNVLFVSAPADRDNKEYGGRHPQGAPYE